MPFTYAEMTAVEGTNIDNDNHGMFKPLYPTTICGVHNQVSTDKPINVNGELPEGTVINLYLGASYEDCKLTVYGDDEILAEDNLKTCILRSNHRCRAIILTQKAIR